MADSVTNVVSVTVITRHDSQFGVAAFEGIITGGDPRGVYVQSAGGFPMRFEFSEMHSLNIHT